MWQTIKDVLSTAIISFKTYELTVGDLLIIGMAYMVVRFLASFLRNRLTQSVFLRNNIDWVRRSSVLQILQYLLYTLFFIFCLETVGVDLSLVLAGSAALLVGLGFGVQQIFNDLVSGLIMLFEGNVAVGDVLEVDHMVGKVEHVGLRTSKVYTRDGVTIVVPNSKFIVENVVNWTHMRHAVRFDVAVGVAYGSDVALVKRLLLEVAYAHAKVAQDPAPFVRFLDFGNSSLDFKLYFWCSEVWTIEDVKSDLRFAIDAIFREHRITIPFPQRDVHIIPPATA
jgi:small-conductance mechanosensitive channel